MDEELKIRFRVSAVFRACRIKLLFDGTEVYSKKKAAAAPGEMEELKVTKAQLSDFPDLCTITLCIEEGEE